ncbi:MAG: hypothetical protein WDZ89_04535 [Gemmatimonadota bacterium]
MTFCSPDAARTTERPRPGLRLLVPLVAAVTFLAACESDSIRPAPVNASEVGIVLNSVELSLTIFPVEDPTSTVTVGLGADGSPVGFSARNGLVAVPMGTYPAVAIVDIADGVVLRSIGLPEGSGATGSAFLNDSILLVGNPGLNAVSPVNVLRGTRGESIPTGTYPQAVVVHDGTAFVLNAELGDDWQPARTGTVTVLDGATLDVRNLIELSGENPAGGVVVDGMLHVLNAGRWGENSGTLSVVDPAGEEEVDFVEGFGDLPGTLAAGPGGVLSFTSWSFGLGLWDTGSASFIRSPENAISIGGVPSAAGSGFDASGRLYALAAECQNAAVALRLDANFETDVEIPVGVCPAHVDFLEITVPVDRD